jgi:hypothetical protein
MKWPVYYRKSPLRFTEGPLNGQVVFFTYPAGVERKHTSDPELKETKQKAMNQPVTEMQTSGYEGTTIDHPAFSGGQ